MHSFSGRIRCGPAPEFQINYLLLHELILNISPYAHVAYDCMVVFVLLHHETVNLVLSGKLHLTF